MTSFLKPGASSRLSFSGAAFQDHPDLAGFKTLIHEKDARHHPLRDTAQDLNRINSVIKACVEHIFCCKTMSMGEKLTKKIELEEDRGLVETQESDFQLPWLSPGLLQFGTGCQNFTMKHLMS